MFEMKFVLVCFLYASVYAHAKEVRTSSTTQKTPDLDNRFFGLGNILGQIFHRPHNPGFGANFQHLPEYHNQQNPQDLYSNWQNIQTPNQAQSNLDQSPQGSFYPQNNFVPGGNQNMQTPQQLPNQQIFNQQSNMNQYPDQNAQGNFNTGNFNPNFNTGGGTLDDIPYQNEFNGNLNQRPGNQFQNQTAGNMMGNQNGNQFGTQNQNGNQAQNQNFGNQNGNQDVQNQNGNQIQNQNFGNQNANQGVQNQNGNQFQNQNFGNQNAGQFGMQNTGHQGFQNQSPHDDDYNPVAILGKPVHMTTSIPDSIVFTDGCDTPTHRQCVQDCQSTTEYNPVCGSNNVTYFNPGRFICARNCGIDVYVQRAGKCYR